MKKKTCIAVIMISVYIAAITNANVIAASSDIGVSAQILQNPTGNFIKNDTADQSATSIENVSPLVDLIIDHAGGDITSLQTDEDNKTWITAGKWDLTSGISNANQSSSTVVQFNATIDMKGVDNSAEHQHKVSEFELTNSSISSSREGSLIVFNGTGSIETDVGLYSSVPISIKIIDGAPAIVISDTQTKELELHWVPTGGTISVLIDESVEDHFGSTPIYGKVKKE